MGAKLYVPTQVVPEAIQTLKKFGPAAERQSSHPSRPQDTLLDFEDIKEEQWGEFEKVCMKASLGGITFYRVARTTPDLKRG